MSTAKTDSTSGKAAAERLSGEEAHHKDRNTEGQPSGKAVSRPLPAGCSLRILTDFAEKQKTRPLYEEAFGDPEDFSLRRRPFDGPSESVHAFHLRT